MSIPSRQIPTTTICNSNSVGGTTGDSERDKENEYYRSIQLEPGKYAIYHGDKLHHIASVGTIGGHTISELIELDKTLREQGVIPSKRKNHD